MSNDIDGMERVGRKTIYRFGKAAAHTARERAAISDGVRRHALGRDVVRYRRGDQASKLDASMMNESDTEFLSTRELLIGLGLASPLLLVLALIVKMIVE